MNATSKFFAYVSPLTFALCASCTVTAPHIAKIPVPPLKGIVIDSVSQLPIKDASVKFRGLSKTETQTDNKGHFETKYTDNKKFTMLTHFYVTQDLHLEVQSPGYIFHSLPVYQKSAFDGRAYEKNFIRIPLTKITEGSSQ